MKAHHHSPTHPPFMMLTAESIDLFLLASHHHSMAVAPLFSLACCVSICSNTHQTWRSAEPPKIKVKSDEPSSSVLWWMMQLRCLVRDYHNEIIPDAVRDACFLRTLSKTVRGKQNFDLEHIDFDDNAYNQTIWDSSQGNSRTFAEYKENVVKVRTVERTGETNSRATRLPH